jgi:hypothetical protein
MSARQTSHPSDDRLIDLAVGLLPAQEATASLAHLGTCAACEQRFREIAGERARIAAEREPEVRARTRVWAGVAAAAAAAVLLSIALLPGPRHGVEAGPPPYWLPTDRDEAVLRADGEAESSTDLARALAVYRSRDARLAATLLSEAQVAESHERLRKLYLASALALAGDAAQASTVLDDVDETAFPEPWRSQARWVGYTVACAVGDAARAEERLHELRSAKGEIGDLVRRERERRAAAR